MKVTHTPRLNWLAALVLAVALVACPNETKPKPPSTTPNPVTFVPANDVNLSAVTESNPVTISGINTVSVSVTGGEYKIGDAGAYTGAAGTIKTGDKIQLRTTAASTLNTAKDVKLTVGTSTFTFTVTTKKTAGDVSFVTKIDQPWATAVESNTATLSGINPSTPISVSGGSYKVNAGAYTTTAGTVKDGDTVTVKGDTASADLTDKVVTLTIGSGPGAQVRSFTVRTGKRIPDDFTLAAATDQDPGAVVTRAITFSSPNITIPTPASIAGGTFTVNGAPGVSGAFINPGDAIIVSGAAPATADGSSQNVVLTVGGKSATLSITTKNQNPAINFTPQTGVTPNISDSERYWTGTHRCTFDAVGNPLPPCVGLSGDPRYQQPPLPPTPTFTESNTVTLSSISPNAPVSIVGGEYSVNGAAYSSTPGTVNPGDTLRVRLSAIFPGALHKATVTFGAGTSSFTTAFNVTTLGSTVQNVWTPNAAIAPITIPNGGTASSTFTVPNTTAKIAKVRVLVAFNGNSVRRSAHIVRLIPPSGTGVSSLRLMDFVTSKPAGNGLPEGINPLDPSNTGPAPSAITVPLKTGSVSEQPWPWNALNFISYGGGGGINAIFDSSNFGTNAAAGPGQGGDYEIGSGTDTYVDGGINRNDVYRRCGTDFYAVQKKKYIAYDLDGSLNQAGIDSLNASLNRDLPRAGAIDPYTGKVDTRGGTSAAPESPIVTGEYTDGTCSRNTGNVYYPPIAPDSRIGNLTALNAKNPSGTWTLEVQQTEPGSAPVTITAFKLIFDFAP